MRSITKFLLRKLKLKVNASKSAVDRPWNRKFLGFTLSSRKPKIAIAESSVKRFKTRIREVTGRSRGVSFERVAEELKLYLRGWSGYFGCCEQRSILAVLESWLHRRLRCFLWKQWGKARYQELRRRGISLKMAKRMVSSGHGPWRLSRSQALSYALPGKYFDSLNIPRLNIAVIT